MNIIWIRNTVTVMLIGFAVITPTAVATPTKPSATSRAHHRNLEKKQGARAQTKECTQEKRTTKNTRYRTKRGGRWHYKSR